MAIASSAMEMRSPAVSSMSSSRGGGSVETRLASAIRSSVESPIAETTTTTSWPACLVATTRSATCLILGASATEVPPYFCTIKAIGIRSQGVWSRGRATSGPRCPARPDRLESLPGSAGRAPRAGPRAPSGRSDPHVASAGEGAAEGDLVGVLKVAADRQAAGQPRHPHPERRQQPRQVHGGGLALDVGVGGDDHLADPVRLDPREQLADVQVVRADALDGADRPADDVVAAAELARLLDRHQVARLLDHAHQGRVAAWVLADPAGVAFGDVPAVAAEVHPGLDLVDGHGQPLRVRRLDLEQVEGDPLGALGPDPGKPPELVDQILDRAFIHVEKVPPAGLEAEARGQRQPLGDVVQALRGQVLGLAQALVHGGGHQVAQHLGVLGVDGVGVDRDRVDHAVALDLGRDDPAAGGALDDLLGQLVLGVLHLLLHLLDLLQHLVRVEPAAAHAHRLPLSLRSLDLGALARRPPEALLGCSSITWPPSSRAAQSATARASASESSGSLWSLSGSISNSSTAGGSTTGGTAGSAGGAVFWTSGSAASAGSPAGTESPTTTRRPRPPPMTASSAASTCLSRPFLASASAWKRSSGENSSSTWRFSSPASLPCSRKVAVTRLARCTRCITSPQDRATRARSTGSAGAGAGAAQSSSAATAGSGAGCAFRPFPEGALALAAGASPAATIPSAGDPAAEGDPAAGALAGGDPTGGDPAEAGGFARGDPAGGDPPEAGGVARGGAGAGPGSGAAGAPGSAGAMERRRSRRSMRASRASASRDASGMAARAMPTSSTSRWSVAVRMSR